MRLLAALVTATALVAFGGGGAADAASCLEGAQCGSVTVPLDRAHPGAGAINIAYAFVPHGDSSSRSLGTVGTNPGGPGQSTIASASLYLQGAPQLFGHRDLLLIDPRGTRRVRRAHVLELEGAPSGRRAGDREGVRGRPGFTRGPLRIRCCR